MEPVDEETHVRKGDEVTFLLFRERREDAVSWLKQEGWTELSGDRVAPDKTADGSKNASV